MCRPESSARAFPRVIFKHLRQIALPYARPKELGNALDLTQANDLFKRGVNGGGIRLGSQDPRGFLKHALV
jgi:hypothetical protein